MGTDLGNMLSDLGNMLSCPKVLAYKMRHCGPRNEERIVIIIVATYLGMTLSAMHLVVSLKIHEGLVETGLAPTTIEYLNEEQLRELLFNRWKRGIVECCSSVFGGEIAHSARC